MTEAQHPTGWALVKMSARTLRAYPVLVMFPFMFAVGVYAIQFLVSWGFRSFPAFRAMLQGGPWGYALPLLQVMAVGWVGLCLQVAAIAAIRNFLHGGPSLGRAWETARRYAGRMAVWAAVLVPIVTLATIILVAYLPLGFGGGTLTTWNARVTWAFLSVLPTGWIVGVVALLPVVVCEGVSLGQAFLRVGGLGGRYVRRAIIGGLGCLLLAWILQVVRFEMGELSVWEFNAAHGERSLDYYMFVGAEGLMNVASVLVKSILFTLYCVILYLSAVEGVLPAPSAGREGEGEWVVAGEARVKP